MKLNLNYNYKPLNNSEIIYFIDEIGYCLSKITNESDTLYINIEKNEQGYTTGINAYQITYIPGKILVG